MKIPPNPAADGLADKASLRRHLIAARKALPVAERHAADRRIVTRLAAWLAQRETRVLGGYLPLAGEPDLYPLYAQLARQGMVVAMPVVTERHAALAYAAWQPGDVLEKDASGTLAPLASLAAQGALRPEVVLVPCVGYNDAGLRLGYGGGYFDRTLALSPRPVAVGVAYACSRADFPADDHDVALDLVIAE